MVYIYTLFLILILLFSVQCNHYFEILFIEEMCFYIYPSLHLKRKLNTLILFFSYWASSYTIHTPTYYFWWNGFNHLFSPTLFVLWNFCQNRSKIFTYLLLLAGSLSEQSRHASTGSRESEETVWVENDQYASFYEYQRNSKVDKNLLVCKSEL